MGVYPVSAARPTVLIVDDHPVWRRGLRDVLERHFEVVAEAGEGGEGVDQALARQPDVVIMDIYMPGMDGIAATKEIKQALPDTGVVIMSEDSDDEQVHSSIQAGVNSYLLKDAAPPVIIEAVARAAEGAAYLPPEIAKRVLQSIRSNGASTVSGLDLSARETSVLRLVTQGYQHKEIARELGISPRTVSNHVASIYNKLGINDRAQAIIYAIKKGIVSP